MVLVNIICKLASNMAFVKSMIHILEWMCYELLYANVLVDCKIGKSLRGKSSLPNQNKLLCWEIGWCGLSWLAWIFKSNFHCLIRPYLEKLFSKSLMKLGDGLMTSKSERQRTSGPQKGQSLILFTVRNVTDRAHASSICPLVLL